MFSMPSSRQSFFFSSFYNPYFCSCSSSLFCIFFFLTTFLYSSVFSTNHEASALFSWLHTSSSSIPTSSFSNWNILDTNPCNWTSITCSPQGFVTEINIQSVPLQLPVPSNLSSFRFLHKLVISDDNLTGAIPAEIGDCPSLTAIDLSSNSLVGSIPASIGKLRNLESLILNSNQLTGRIPIELSNCLGLKNLLVFDNQLAGTIPPELGKLSKLEVLRAGGNKDIIGNIPHELGDCRKFDCNCPELVNLFLYENSLSGYIPSELGKLQKLEQLLLWQNSLVGSIPEEIGGLLELEEFMISNNNVSGSIPSNLSNATNLLQTNLEGSIPSTLASCSNLQAIDLSHNALTGSIPTGLFQLKNLTKLLLISNDISGSIPPEIGNCSSLVRLRLGSNRIAGSIPKSIGNLRSLNFLDFSGNRLSGPVPDEIGSCTELQMIDLSSNTLDGPLPNTLSSVSELQVLDASSNRFSGQVPASLGRLVSLNKLILNRNSFSGTIPPSIGLCSSLQMLDLSSNQLTGSIPMELGRIEALEIALNLSCNSLSGPIPVQISALSKLSILDLSHNKLEGDLNPLSGLDNLVSLNVSYNNFTGYLPDNKLFRQLSPTDLTGNQDLCSSGQDSCFLSDVGMTRVTRNDDNMRKSRRLKLAIASLIVLTVVMVVMGITAVIRARRTIRDDESELGDSWPWQFTPFQKLNFSVDQILRCLVDSNIIGKGCSGIVYRADMDNGEVIAVKKLWPITIAAGSGCKGEISGVRDSFSAEVKTLGSIRHKNIVRFLGCCWNRNTRLLMYDYMPNGSLGSLLHERTGNSLEWELSLLMTVILARSSNTVAGSYGYIAPEYGYMMKITEKSDVYSYGVVVLEVLTGKQPIDPTIPDGLHVVDWVRQKRGGIEVLDSCLLSRPESEIEEMLQALGIALLCVNSSPDERPTMKDVAAMLKEIKHEREEYAKVDVLLKGSPANNANENKNSNGLPATSSSAPAVHSLYPKSNHTSFSASSLLYSSASSAKLGFK
ncbi:Receptor-like protein kinase [Quillaja saponaria]|uniref:non-specific serine/threonine protein kinase n=1 Tax=Quillaja saponaria TaxID=32244 RepID=A0AAD7VL38_QUISA|nr:Receptor-like protein kinase [Quillaja saponaria]